MIPIDRPADSTEGRILAAAMEEFAARGYAAATVRGICTRAGVNLALVNYHFGSKEKLYSAVVEQVFAAGPATLMGMADRVKDEASWREAMRTWVSTSLEVITAQRPPLSYIASLVAHSDQAPAAVLAELKARFHVPLRRELFRLVMMAMPPDKPRRELELEASLWCSGIEAHCLAHARPGDEWTENFRPAGLTSRAWVKAEIGWICRGIFAQLHYMHNA